MTIREFARSIGVSPTTVSRVMHGRGRISAATRQMVLERIQELGFTPNLNAQRLSHGRTNLIALDFGTWSDYLSHLFFMELTRVVQEVLQTQGYGVLLSGPGEAAQRWVKTRAVDGVILVTGDAVDETVPENSIVHEIARMGTPCVVIGHHPMEGLPGVGSVAIGLQHGIRQVAHLLVANGHRNIGFIGGEQCDFVLPTFCRELNRLGVGLSESSIVIAGHTPQDGAKSCSQLLAQDAPPTAIFARTDAFAIGALHTAHTLGVRVPKELSLIGHDDVPFAALTQPPLTTVRVDCAEIARLAADMLFALLSAPNIFPKPQVVHSELVIRETVSTPRSAVRLRSLSR